MDLKFYLLLLLGLSQAGAAFAAEQSNSPVFVKNLPGKIVFKNQATAGRYWVQLYAAKHGINPGQYIDVAAYNFIIHQDQQHLNRLLVGPVESFAEAQQLKQQFVKSNRQDVFVRYSEITRLDLSLSENVIDSLSNAETIRPADRPYQYTYFETFTPAGSSPPAETSANYTDSMQAYERQVSSNRKALLKSAENMILDGISHIGVDEGVTKSIVGSSVFMLHGGKINLNDDKTFFIDVEDPTSGNSQILFNYKHPLD